MKETLYSKHRFLNHVRKKAMNRFGLTIWGQEHKCLNLSGSFCVIWVVWLIIWEGGEFIWLGAWFWWSERGPLMPECHYASYLGCFGKILFLWKKHIWEMIWYNRLFKVQPFPRYQVKEGRRPSSEGSGLIKGLVTYLHISNIILESFTSLHQVNFKFKFLRFKTVWRKPQAYCPGK